MPFKTNKAETGLDEQTAKLNSRPPQGDEIEDTRDAGEKYAEWKRTAMVKLGVDSFTKQIKTDNAHLVAALALIASSGAPDPIKTTETIALPHGEGAWKTNVYTFVHFQNPRLQLKSTEYLLALNPDVLIAELKQAGIRKG